MNKDKKMIKQLVLLWYETQMGNMQKCKEKQVEFSDIMWNLHEKIDKESNEI